MATIKMRRVMQKLPHLGLTVGEVTPDVLVVGDPARAERASAWLDEPVLMAEKREYRTYHGRFQGMPVIISSHGVGAPGAAIAFEELIAGGASRIIRVGTCGGLQPQVVTGNLVVVTAAVQHTGYGDLTVPKGYPAVADARLMLALQTAAQADNHVTHCGIVLSSDSFYPGISSSRPRYDELAQANVLAVEMECAALFIIGSLRQVQTAAILVADGNVLQNGEQMDSYQPNHAIVSAAVDAEIGIALKALWHERQRESG